MLDIIQNSIFIEIAILLLLGTGLSILALKFKQPLLIVFILTGFLAGPAVLNIVHSPDLLKFLSHIGITILLFLVGLKLDLKMVKNVGTTALLTGLGQILFTALFGFWICRLLGLSSLISLYVSIALTFSSTIIIIKLLSDKREVDSLHGRISLGFLIVQDLFVIIAMIVFSAFGMDSQAEGGSIAMLLGSLLLLVVCLILFIKFFAERVLSFISKSSELLLLFAISLAMIMSGITELLGLGMELGGLIAGIALASTSSRDSIASRLSGLRDFLLFFFFVSLGLSIEFGALSSQIVPAVILSLFILIGNPLIVMIILGLLGYRKRTGFLAGLTVAQISEFSLIFLQMGEKSGHVPRDVISMVTIVGLLTIAVCSYMMMYSHQLYNILQKYLSIFEGRHTKRKVSEYKQFNYDIVVLGLGNYGQMIMEELKNQDFKVFGVDFNQENVNMMKKKGYDVSQADISDVESLSSLPILQSNVCVCVTTPSSYSALVTIDPRHILLQHLKNNKYKGRVVMRAGSNNEVDILKKIGVEIVLNPYQYSAKYLHMMLNRRKKLL